MDALLLDAATAVTKMTAKPENYFFNFEEKNFANLKSMAKIIYDTAKISEKEKSSKATTLPEMVIQDFDEEQIWSELELQNSAIFSGQKLTSSLISKTKSKSLLEKLFENEGQKSKAEKTKKVSFELPDRLKEKLIKESEGEAEGESEDEDDQSDIPDMEEEDEKSDEEGEEDEDEDNPFDDPDFQNMSDSDGDDLPLFENEKSEDEKDESSDEEDESREEDEKKSREEKEQKIKNRKDIDSRADDYLSKAMGAMKKREGLDSKEESEDKRILKKKAPKNSSSARTQVEDEFFKLDDMEKFLDAQDQDFERKRLKEEKGLDDNDSENEDEMNLFAADDDQDSDLEKDERAKYKDYFGGDGEAEETQGDSEDESDQEEEEEEKSSDKDEAEENNSNEESESDDDEKNDEKQIQDLGEVKSTFEERQIRLRKKIEKLEDEAIAEKSWEIKGEIAGPARPENSLLEQHLDYDTVAKQAPVITESVSKTLEDIILQRIKDKAFDSVERKAKPVEDPFEYKKRLVLDQEKSKLSLAQVYELEYLKQKGEAEEKEKPVGLLDDEGQDKPAEIESIRSEMNSLFSKLDALTHYHYTPQSKSAEVKVVKNVASISVEDVAPLSKSDADLLAPQEMADAKRGEMLGKSERTSTDKKRERRKKKAKQSKKQKQNVAKNGAAASMGADKKSKKNGEKKSSTTKEKAVKSSTDFFDKLQTEVQNEVSKGNGKKRKHKSDSEDPSGKVKSTRLKL